MTRRILTKKFYPKIQNIYNSLIIELFINRLMYSGEKLKAKTILLKALNLISSSKPKLYVLEKAIRNVKPCIELKAKRIHGVSRQVPTIISEYKAITKSIKWIIQSARARSGSSIEEKLAKEILDASTLQGGAIKKKEEVHKMAIANKVYLV